jgi:Na+-transporting NADH:ubiquinone oxidoreductase subunit NqrB
MFIIIPINIVKVYYNLALALYAKGLVFKAVVAISVMSTAISKWLKALLASSILIKVTLLDINSLKIVK